METAELFQEGEDQAVRLPEACQFAGDRVFIKQVGNAIVLLPLDNPWEPLFRSLDLFSADFLNEREQPKEKT